MFTLQLNLAKLGGWNNMEDPFNYIQNIEIKMDKPTDPHWIQPLTYLAEIAVMHGLLSKQLTNQCINEEEKKLTSVQMQNKKAEFNQIIAWLQQQGMHKTYLRSFLERLYQQLEGDRAFFAHLPIYNIDSRPNHNAIHSQNTHMYYDWHRHITTPERYTPLTFNPVEHNSWKMRPPAQQTIFHQPPSLNDGRMDPDPHMPAGLRNSPPPMQEWVFGINRDYNADYWRYD